MTQEGDPKDAAAGRRRQISGYRLSWPGMTPLSDEGPRLPRRRWISGAARGLTRFGPAQSLGRRLGPAAGRLGRRFKRPRPHECEGWPVALSRPGTDPLDPPHA